VLGVAPKPDSAGATVDVRAASDDGVRRRVIRRIVIVEAPSADADDPVHVEVTPASSDVGAAAPAAPAPVVTGGS
jgi:hypothetical protein